MGFGSTPVGPSRPSVLFTQVRRLISTTLPTLPLREPQASLPTQHITTNPPTGHAFFLPTLDLIFTHSETLPSYQASTYPLTYPQNPASKTMATQRIISSEKTILDKDDMGDASSGAGTQSNIAPAVPMYVHSSSQRPPPKRPLHDGWMDSARSNGRRKKGPACKHEFLGPHH